MSIEKHIADLTAALIANTEAVQALLKAQGGKAPAGKGADKEEAEEKPAKPAGKAAGGKAKPAASDDEDEITEEVMKAALNKVKEDLGSDEAKKIIKTVAKVEKMADIPEGKRAAVVKKCKEVLAAAEGGEGEGEEDGL